MGQSAADDIRDSMRPYYDRMKKFLGNDKPRSSAPTQQDRDANTTYRKQQLDRVSASFRNQPPASKPAPRATAKRKPARSSGRR